MKFLNFDAFEKHLRESFPDHPSSMYAIFATCPIERRYVIDSILSFFPCSEKEKYTVEKDSVEKVHFAMCSPSLFSNHRILLYDGIDKLNTDSLCFLADTAPSFFDKILFVVSGASTVPLSSFYQKRKQDVVLLDLSREKPWERLERQRRWIIQLAHKQEKVLLAESAKELVELCRGNFAALCSELEKWITFSMEKKTLALSAWQKVSSFDARESTGWEVSRELVWETACDFSAKKALLAIEFYSLVGQLRYQLKLGLSIAKATQEGSEEDLYIIFPNLRPQTVNKYKLACSQLTESYFCFGLKALADLEGKARLGLDQGLLLDYFAMRLKEKKNHVA